MVIWFLKFSFSEKATKKLRNLPHGFDIYLVNVKTTRTIVQTFVAFSEKLNISYLIATVQSTIISILIFCQINMIFQKIVDPTVL